MAMAAPSTVAHFGVNQRYFPKLKSGVFPGAQFGKKAADQGMEMDLSELGFGQTMLVSMMSR